MQLGFVRDIIRHPVKSMRGTSLGEAWLDALGVAGDRAYALRDEETGTIASAKHPRKWAALLESRASYLDGDAPGSPISITLPSSRRLEGPPDAMSAQLSAALGRRVALVTGPTHPLTRETLRGDADIEVEPMGLGAPPGRYHDHGPLHVLTTATLRALASLRPEVSWTLERFRPNLVIEHEGAGFAELAWLGQTIEVGAVALEIFDPTPRCAVTTVHEGARDPSILRTLARHTSAPSHTLAPGHVFPAVVGVYARVLAPGRVTVGDPVRLIG